MLLQLLLLLWNQSLPCGVLESEQSQLFHAQGQVKF